ncbi:MAG: FAD binding domain-containing protein [Clostridiales bacterium]
MYSFREYVQAESLSQAYELLEESRRNIILGGCLWLKMGRKNYGKAIDLSALDLSYIKEQNDFLEIGAMTSLRDLETSPLLKNIWGDYFSASLGNIVGCQFRNSATLGGSLWGRFGFSDIAAALLALGGEICLYHQGRISVEDFLLYGASGRDIIEKIIIPKDFRQAAYQRMSNSATDFPVLIASAAYCENSGLWRLVLGARPQRAGLCLLAQDFLAQYLPQSSDPEGIIAQACQIAGEELHLGSNLRADGEYRRSIAPVLLSRAIGEVLNNGK